MTHHHVIADADDIDDALADRRKFKSKLIDSDPKTDIALRKIESKDPSKPIISG